MGDVRTLFLLRHAKSSWADPAVPDHDRPLDPSGVRAARRMADHVISRGDRPALVLCSSARRAVDTLEALRPALGDSARIQVEDDLYGADGREILDQLRKVQDQIGSVMVVGHNPALHDLAIELAGNGEESAMSQLRTKFPPGALATLDLGKSGWSQLGPGRAYLARMVLPKQLP